MNTEDSEKVAGSARPSWRPTELLFRAILALCLSGAAVAFAYRQVAEARAVRYRVVGGGPVFLDTWRGIACDWSDWECTNLSKEIARTEADNVTSSDGSLYEEYLKQKRNAPAPASMDTGMLLDSMVRDPVEEYLRKYGRPPIPDSAEFEAWKARRMVDTTDTTVRR